MTFRKLTPAEAAVIEKKGTELPFTGRYYRFDQVGTYACRRCGAPLFSSEAKFDARCGWPSFDRVLPGAVREQPDADGHRVEIVCAACRGHLGHVFRGEGFTDQNTRHCVNSLSLDFVSATDAPTLAIGTLADEGQSPGAQDDRPAMAYFAGGCFWGVEHLLQQLEGVITVRSGYMGGHVPNPTYREVCGHETGHVETVEVVYDPTRVSYEEVAQRFFEIHDPTQANGQGPDLGPQYLSVVFTQTPDERDTVRRLIQRLMDRGYEVVTRVEDANAHPFWPAEAYHQNFLLRNHREPSCHGYVNRFGD